MRRIDQKRFAQFVADFVADNGISPPLYLIAISESNGTVIVSHHDANSNVVEVCKHTVGPGMVAPIIVTAVSEETARSASAKIDVVAPPQPRMQ
jgi:hypothetical protein